MDEETKLPAYDNREDDKKIIRRWKFVLNVNFNKNEKYDPVHELLCDVMERAVRDFLYLYSRKGDDQIFYSALGHILNDDNWEMLGMDIRGEEAIRTIIKNNKDKIGKWARCTNERTRNG